MSDDNNGRFNLSRRKALAGLGGIGATAALGGLGTTALYGDTESTDLTISAGTLDLLVDATVFYYSERDDGTTSAAEQIVDIQEHNPEGDTLSFNLNDVKPGDCFCIVLSVHLDGNPAWVRANCALNGDVAGTDTEPERDAQSSDGINAQTADGQLDTRMKAMSSVVTVSSDNLSSCPEELSTDIAASDYTTYLADLDSHIDYFDGDTGTQELIEPLGSQETRWMGYKVCLPVDENNVTQGDKISISCTFEAEQARNNPVPDVLTSSGVGSESADFNNPYVDESPSTSTSS